MNKFWFFIFSSNKNYDETKYFGNCSSHSIDWFLFIFTVSFCWFFFIFIKNKINLWLSPYTRKKISSSQYTKPHLFWRVKKILYYSIRKLWHLMVSSLDMYFTLSRDGNLWGWRWFIGYFWRLMILISSGVYWDIWRGF